MVLFLHEGKYKIQVNLSVTKRRGDLWSLWKGRYQVWEKLRRDVCTSSSVRFTGRGRNTSVQMRKGKESSPAFPVQHCPQQSVFKVSEVSPISQLHHERTLFWSLLAVFWPSRSNSIVPKCLWFFFSWPVHCEVLRETTVYLVVLIKRKLNVMWCLAVNHKKPSMSCHNSSWWLSFGAWLNSGLPPVLQNHF